MNGSSLSYLQEKIALPPSLLSLFTNDVTRVDGYILTPFRYDGNGRERHLYDNGYIVEKETILNTEIGMMNDYRARVATAAITSDCSKLLYEDVDSLFRDYCGKHGNPHLPVMTGVPLEMLVKEEQDAVDVVEGTPQKEDCSSGTDDKEVVSRQSSSDEVSSELWSSQVTLASEAVEAVQKEFKESFSCVLKQNEDLSEHPFLQDFLYHGKMYIHSVTRPKVGDHYSIYLRRYAFSTDNDPYSPQGAIHYAINFVRKDMSQHVFYIVLKKPNLVRERDGNRKGMSGAQLGLIFTHHSSGDGLRFRYSRASINIMLFLQRKHSVPTLKVGFFSHEFGSLHDAMSPDSPGLSHMFSQVTRKLTNMEAVEDVSVYLKDQFLTYLADNEDIFEYHTFCALESGDIPKFEGSLAQKQTQIFQCISAAYPRVDHSCIERMVNTFPATSGFVYGSKVIRKEGLFYLPCGRTTGTFDEYDSHPCSVRAKAVGIMSTRRFESSELVLGSTSLFVCQECFRGYETKLNCMLCNYFCVSAALYLYPDSCQTKDAYGRTILM